MTRKSLRPDIPRWHHAFFDSGDFKLKFDICCCLLPCGDRYVSQYGGSAAALFLNDSAEGRKMTVEIIS